MALHTKKLYYRRGGTTYSIDLYTTTAEVGAEYISLRDGSTTVYAKIDAVGSANESFLRVRKSGISKSIISIASPIELSSLLKYDFSNTSCYPGSGTAVTNIGTGGALNATLTNGVGFSSTNGGILTFDGVDDYIMLTTRVTVPLSEGTISIWYNPTSWTPSGNGEYIWCAGGAPFSGGTFHWIGAHPAYSTNLCFGVFHTEAHRIAAHTSAPTVGNWHHVIGAWGTFGIKIAVNGYYTGSNSNINWSYYGSTTDTPYEYLGTGGNPGTGAVCTIGGFKVFNTALTDAQVLNEFNATKARFGL